MKPIIMTAIICATIVAIYYINSKGENKHGK